MDYPKSTPNVGLVDGKFIDENTVTGQVGSLIPSAWGNAVTEEILAVIKAAGIAPSEAEQNQLLKAIHSSELFTTAPKFTSTKAAATTEFVQQALGNKAGISAFSASGTLPVEDVGKLVVVNAAANTTMKIPLLSDVLRVGAVIGIINTTPSVVTVTPSGVDQLSSGATPIASFTLGHGDSAEIVRGGVGWTLFGGSGQLKYSAAFAASLATNSHQKHPSGAIDQWGTATALGAGELRTIVLPVAFPVGARVPLCVGDGANPQVRVAALGTGSIQIQNLGTAGQNAYWRVAGN